MQSSYIILILRIHIRTDSQELLYCFDITTACSAINRPVFAAVFAQEVGGFPIIIGHI